MTRGLLFSKRKTDSTNPGLCFLVWKMDSCVTLNRQVITCWSKEAEQSKEPVYTKSRIVAQVGIIRLLPRFACKPTKENDARGSGKSFTDWTWPHVRARPFSLYRTISWTILGNKMECANLDGIRVWWSFCRIDELVSKALSDWFYVAERWFTSLDQGVRWYNEVE